MRSHLAPYMKAPLLIGASVSNDQNSASPGKILAHRYHSDADFRKIAKDGTPGFEVLKLATPASLSDRTSIIALDTFFWDSGYSDARRSLKALNHLVALARSYKLPLVLGDIPELLRGHQPGRPVLNREIHFRCAELNVALMPFDSLHRELATRGTLLIQGQQRSFRDIAPDGLHLARFASEYLADVLEIALATSWLKI